MRTVILGFAVIALACLIAATALSRDIRELLENIGKALFVLAGGLAAFRYLPKTPNSPNRYRSILPVLSSTPDAA